MPSACYNRLWINTDTTPSGFYSPPQKESTNITRSVQTETLFFFVRFFVCDKKIMEPVDDDPFLRKYQPSDLKIASEFLTTWLPFLSRDLCSDCVHVLSRRIRSLHPGFSDSSSYPFCSNGNIILATNVVLACF